MVFIQCDWCPYKKRLGCSKGTQRNTRDARTEERPAEDTKSRQSPAKQWSSREEISEEIKPVNTFI